MKKYVQLFLLIVSLVAFNFTVKAQTCTPTAVTKTNTLKIYAHWMPWFFAPRNPGTGTTGYATNVNATGSWGQHWCNNGSQANPNNLSTITDYTGASVQARNVDAHFHPLIGPYDESDPNVLEYHLLLMKYSGIDGVIIDWYGFNGNGAADAGANQVNSAAMIADVGNYGLKYSLAVEDASMSNLGANLSGASGYFNDANYVRLGDLRGSAAANATAPLTLDFEPYSNTNTGTWNAMGNTKALLTYYGQSYNTIASIAGGEFMWPWPQGGQGITNGVPTWYNDINTYYNGSFYTGGAPNVHNNFRCNGVGLYNNVVLGIAYPGFFDFYRGDASSYTDPNAGCCDQYGIIPRNYNGNTLSATLNLAKANQGVIDGIQIATWNDFTEGTVIEPTVEYGFSSLATIQQFTGVPYTVHNLMEIYKMYTLRKTYAGNTAVQNALNTASCDYASLDTLGAQTLIDCIATNNGNTSACLCSTPPSGTISYAGSPYCKSLTTGQSVAQTGTTGGTYTSTPAGLSISSSTGAITPSSSTAGSYTVTYTMTASGCTTATATTTVTITTLPSATISYSGTPFCKTAGVQTVTQTGTTGGSYSSAGGLSLNTSTGAITPSSSTAGSYTVTYTMAAASGCSSQTATTAIAITAVPSATVSYTGSPFCKSLGAQTVTQTGTTGGTYSSAGGLSLNTSTGAITPSSSTAGSYTITYTMAANGGCALQTATAAVTITAVPGATISYSGSPYCASLGAQAITQTGTTGGTYSATPGGLSLNTGTGAVTPSSSTAGTYTVTYTMAAANGCSLQTASTTVTITTTPGGTISYSGTPFCKTLGAQAVTQTGTTGGTYTSTPAGLSISNSTGAVTPSSSTAGNYTITYTMIGCTTVTSTTNITITAVPSATISYTGSPYCTSSGTQAVTQSGTSGGTYSATPGGLSLNTGSGAITPSSSTAGTYTVTYSMTAIGGCSPQTTTTTVTITALPGATISYTGSPFCKNLGAQTVVHTGTTGGAYTSAGGLSLNGVSGAVTPSSSTAGSYTITYTMAAASGCAAQTATTAIAITALPSATISYTGSPYCSSLGAQAVTQTGTGAGTYSSTPAGLSLNTGTGAITPSSSTAGTYTVTYSMGATGGCTAQTATTTVTVTAIPSGTITYAGSPYCKSLGAQTVTQTGTTGGAYTSTSGGLSLNGVSGTITPSSSTAGTYTVTYTMTGCTVATATTSITITAASSATINYAGTPFCKSLGAGQPVNQTGTNGGTYTSNPAGLTISSGTGAIIPSTSTAGTYTVTYTMAATGGCSSQTATTTVAITTLPAATISYAGTPYCTSVTGAQAVTQTGTIGGAYTSTPAGLTINTSTGTITPSSSAGNTYTVTYTMAATGGCSAQTATTSVTINALQTPAISCGASTTTTVGFTWGALSSAGNYAISYIVTPPGGPAGLPVSGGSIALTNYTASAGSIAAADTVTITVTPTGGTGCYTPQSHSCLAISCAVMSATISYAGAPFCSNAAGTKAVTHTGTTGGTYSAGTGLTVDPTTGVITPSSSTPGTYTVTYTMTATGGCPNQTTATTVTITTLPAATISYSGSPYCTNAATKTVTQTGTTGGTYSSAAGLTIDPTTGTITPSSSTAGTYTITYTMAPTGGCTAQTATTAITITALPTATINYAASPYCISIATAQAVTQIGTTGGTYSSTAGLTINTSTGAITPSSSTAGTYTVTYSMNATGGCSIQTATTTVTISSVQAPTISCGASTTTSVGFTWSALTGATNYSLSYIVTPPGGPAGSPISGGSTALTNYTATGGGIAATDTATITVIPTGTGCFTPASFACIAISCPVLSATINYAGVPYCSNATGTEAVTQTGNTGGTYSSTTGLSIDPTTGDITPATSTAGTYTVTYTMTATGGCPNQTVTTTVTINALPAATISYAGTPYCSSATGAQAVTQTGTTGGTYSSATGLTINASTGAITPSSSTAGTYTVTYLMNAAGSCAAQTATTTVTINTVQTPAISCGASSISSVGFTWGTVAGATNYTISYIVTPPGGPAGSPISGGSTALTSYTATGGGIAATDTATIAVTPTGTGCFTPASFACIAVSCPVLSATINYSGAPYCSNATGAESVTQTGNTGGTYSSTTGLTIDPTTGDITPSTSTGGTYTVTYTMTATGGCPNQTATTTVTITSLPTATISYAGSPYCSTVTGTQAVTQTGTTGGTYSSATGLILDPTTGDITPSSSTPGTYTVTYSMNAAGGCAAQTATTTVTINAVQAPTISCGASTTSSVGFTWGAVTGATNYTISYIITPPGGPAGSPISGGSIALTNYTATGGGIAATDTATITVTPTGTGCFTPSSFACIAISCPALSATINYAGAPYCSNATGTEAVTQTGNTGGTYSSTTGLTIDPTTGDITPATSTAGTYTIIYTMIGTGGCPNQTATTTITINTLPAATISYAGSPYCSTVTGTQAVTQTGTTGGTYSSATGLILDPTTGDITPSSSTAGTYTVTYTMAAGGGCSLQTATTTVTINAVQTAAISCGASTTSSIGFTWGAVPGATNYTISYIVTPPGAPAGSPISGGSTALTNYTATGGGIVSTDTATITVTPTGAGCFTPASFACVAISCPVLSATISYTGPFCGNDPSTETVTQTGTVGGTYSSTTGLTIDPTTGDITPATSTAGTYTITYTMLATGGCPNQTATTSITINALPAATIIYSGSPYCSSDATAEPVTQAGTAGGTYTSAPAGLTLNAGTGSITPSSSTAGTYTITYTMAAAGGCSAQTTTTTITISTLPAATINYAAPYCSNDQAAEPVTQIGTGGGTYSAVAGLTINPSTGAITPFSSNTGTYTVTYIMAATGGCTVQTATTSITINTLPAATINYSSPFCSAAAGVETVIQTGTPGGIYSSTAGLTINAGTGSITPSTSMAGIYTVHYTMAAAGGCSTQTATAPVLIVSPPTLTMTDSIVSTEAGFPVKISGYAVPSHGDGVNYSWNPITNISSATINDPLVNPTVETVYTLTASSAVLATCNTNGSVDVRILNPIVTPNVFSPNGDGIHDTWYIKTLEEYPNAKVQVFNRYGQLLYQAEGNYLEDPWTGEFNGHPLPVGTYYYIINLNSGTQLDEKPITGSISIVR